MEEAMRCTFLMGNYLLSCNADKEIYVPSIFEFREYCRSMRYKICPFYLNATHMDKRQVKLEPPRIVRIE